MLGKIVNQLRFIKQNNPARWETSARHLDMSIDVYISRVRLTVVIISDDGLSQTGRKIRFIIKSIKFNMVFPQIVYKFI